jgi:hypothetical protein
VRDEESLIRLGSIEGKVDYIVEHLEKHHLDHEGRIRGVEHKQWWGAGAFSILTALLGSLLYRMH